VNFFTAGIGYKMADNKYTEDVIIQITTEK
jgi:hypothetical protein